jgi:hypothetical protein
MANKKEREYVNRLYKFSVQKRINGTTLIFTDKATPEKNFSLVAPPSIDKNKILSLKEKLYDHVLNHLKEN